MAKVWSLLLGSFGYTGEGKQINRRYNAITRQMEAQVLRAI